MTPESATLLVSAIGAIIALITLVVVVIQLVLMNKQLKLMRRQDEIIARKAELVTEVECDTSSREVVFGVEDTGKRGISSFDWHIWIPATLGESFAMGDVYRPGDKSNNPAEQIKGKDYLHFSGNFRDDLYPTRRKMFAKLKLQPNHSVDGEYTFYTQVACEDGVFPEKVEENPLSVTIKFANPLSSQ